MNCQRCQIELEDFLYGELSQTRSAAVARHLAVCGACRAMRDRLERETAIFARYYGQTALEPSPEMWTAVRARINAESGVVQREGKWWLRERCSLSALGSLLESAMLRQIAFAAVLIIISVAATALYFTLRQKAGGDERVAQRSVVQAEPSPVSGSTSSATPRMPQAQPPQAGTPIRSAKAPRADRVKLMPGKPDEEELLKEQLARAEREYLSAIQMLDRAIVRRKEKLDPTLVAQYEASLALIDNSIMACRAALREHPRDWSAAHFLLAAYARKVELMQEIAMR
jgi:hypothetical protein